MEFNWSRGLLLQSCLSLSWTCYCSLAQTADGETTTAAPLSVVGDLSWYIWLVIGVVFSLTAVIVGVSTIFMGYCCLRLCGRAPSSQNNTNDVQLQEDTLRGIVNNSSSEWEIKRKHIKLIAQLGMGTFGPIYDAEVKLKTDITLRALVKTFQQGTSQDLVSFSSDMEDYKSFQHVNVGKLLGLVSHSPYYLVLELTVNGDLKTFLLEAAAALASSNHENLKRPQAAIKAPQLVAMATDVAAGLGYLESLGYVHRDVAARNCMVTQNLSVKLTDYKIGRHLFRSEYAVQADGSLMPIRWMAPESILTNAFTTQASVWSLGVVLWEVLSQGGFPYADLNDAETMSNVCYHHHRLQRPPYCPEKVSLLMEKCWVSNPKERPRAAAVHRALQASLLTNTYQHPDTTPSDTLY